MVSSVTSNPYYSYLNQLQATPAASSSTGTTAVSPTSSASGTSTASSLVTQLLGGGYTPEVLSLLQGNSAGGFNPITTLLDGPTQNNGETSLYSSLYDSVEAAALTQAQEGAAPGSTPLTTGTTGTASSGSGTANNIVGNLINTQTQASVAYNQTLVQNAQSVASANDYGPNGVTPLVA